MQRRTRFVLVPGDAGGTSMKRAHDSCVHDRVPLMVRAHDRCVHPSHLETLMPSPATRSPVCTGLPSLRTLHLQNQLESPAGLYSMADNAGVVSVSLSQRHKTLKHSDSRLPM